MLLHWLEVSKGIAGNYALAGGVLTLIEMLAPRNEPSMRARLKGLSFTLVYVPIGVAIGLLVHSPLAGIGPIFDLTKIGWIYPLLSLLAYDFFYYWMHRAEHRFLWRFHAVHHSTHKLAALNYYLHPTEPLFIMLMLAWPAAFLFGAVGLEGLAYGSFAHLVHGAFIHSATRLNLGPLRWVLVDNRYHRIHHSMEPRHFDKNFCAIFPLWDWVFGTLHLPARDEWPDTGVAGMSEPTSILDFLTRPFRRRTRATAVAAAE